MANDLRHTLMELKEWAEPKSPEKRLINILDGVYIYKDPYGVVLIIGAWNYPILLSLGPVVGKFSFLIILLLFAIYVYYHYLAVFENHFEQYTIKNLGSVEYYIFFLNYNKGIKNNVIY